MLVGDVSYLKTAAKIVLLANKKPRQLLKVDDTFGVLVDKLYEKKLLINKKIYFKVDKSY
jgi:hypothetical protein